MTASQLALAPFLWIALTAAAQECRFGGQEALDIDAKAIADAPTCRAATDKMHACQWGSSADARLAPIVVSTCEKEFLDGLSSQAKNGYYQRMKLCTYRSSRQQGTISISEAAVCQVDVAADFASHAPDTNRRVLRASFDCTEASTPLEKMICSNQALGDAEIVLSTVYTDLSKNVGPAVRSQLAKSERIWLRQVSSHCGVSNDSKSLTVAHCVRPRFDSPTWTIASRKRRAA